MVCLIGLKKIYCGVLCDFVCLIMLLGLIFVCGFDFVLLVLRCLC